MRQPQRIHVHEFAPAVPGHLFAGRIHVEEALVVVDADGGGGGLGHRPELAFALHERKFRLLTLGDVAVNQVQGHRAATYFDGRSQNGDGHRRAVAAAANGFHIDGLAPVQRVGDKAGFVAAFGGDKKIQSFSDDLRGRVAEHAGELAVDAQHGVLVVQHRDSLRGTLDQLLQVGGLQLQGTLGLLALGDVMNDAEVGVPALVRNVGGAHLHGEAPAVFGDMGVFPVLPLLFPQPPLGQVVLFRRMQRDGRHGEQFFARIAVGLAGGVVAVQETQGLSVDHEHRVGHAVEQAAIKRLGFRDGAQFGRAGIPACLRRPQELDGSMLRLPGLGIRLGLRRATSCKPPR